MQLSDLWNLMETPKEERSFFDHVTCHISATVDEVTADGALALDLIEQVSYHTTVFTLIYEDQFRKVAKHSMIIISLCNGLK